MVLASQLRAGMAIRIDGQVFKVLECDVKAGAGQQGGVVRLRLRSTSSGRIWEPHLRPEERIESLELERQNMEYLYRDGDSCVFMNPYSFEQVEVPHAALGSAEKFLSEGDTLPVEFHEGQPIFIDLPEIVEARIAETAPPAHAGQDTTWKQATLENGLQILVPLFIAPGETIRVDTRDLSYVERARVDRRKRA